ncbi:SagB/ThcOx family dehydrogenase [Mycobacterium decipiens]|nr:SagB/ThcOx family dehydrogenase [Mycobacterium decipiens]
MRLPLPSPLATGGFAAIGPEAVAVIAALGRSRIVEEQVLSGDGRVLAIAHCPTLATASQRTRQVRLHESVFLRRGRIGWTLYRADGAPHVDIEPSAVDFARLIGAPEASDLTAVERLLLDNGLLIDLTGHAERKPVWEFHDELLHSVSVHGAATAIAYGARREASLPQAPLNGTGSNINTHPLPEPEACTTPLDEVFVKRRSCRVFSAEPLSASALATILGLALRSHSAHVANTGDMVRHSYPSAGALDEITTVVASTGPFAGVSIYRHAQHRLEILQDSTVRARELIETLCAPCGIIKPLPCIGLVFAADYAVMAAKYASIAYANILRDVGAVYQTVSLAATAVGAGSCIVGGGWGQLERQSVAGLHENQVVVGGMVLGARGQ